MSFACVTGGESITCYISGKAPAAHFSACIMNRMNKPAPHESTTEEDDGFYLNLIMSQPDNYQPRERHEGDAPFCLLNCQRIEDRGFITWSRESYNRYSFEYIFRGEGILEINGVSYHLTPGDAFILPFGFDHCYRSLSHSGWEKIFFNCTGVLPGTLLNLYGLNGQYHFPGCGRLIESLFVKLHRQFQSTDDVWERTRLGAGTMLEIICELSRQRTAGGCQGGIPAIVQHAIYAIRQSIKEKKVLNIEKLARGFNVTSMQLRRLFRRSLHCSPYDFFLRTKMDMAVEMLRNPMCAIADVARELNFTNAFHFSKMFKRKMGMSPRQFRRQMWGSPGGDRAEDDGG